MAIGPHDVQIMRVFISKDLTGEVELRRERQGQMGLVFEVTTGGPAFVCPCGDYISFWAWDKHERSENGEERRLMHCDIAFTAPLFTPEEIETAVAESKT